MRHVPDRVLHVQRRRMALERLRTHSDARSAAFICHGNINRSAYAAALFASRVPQGRELIVSSAGFIGPGRPASESALQVARRRGIDLSRHQSRSIDGTELAATDLVVVMDTHQQRAVSRIAGRPRADIVILGDLDPQPIDRRTVPDPYGHTIPFFEEVFDRIDRCVAEMCAALWHG